MSSTDVQAAPPAAAPGFMARLTGSAPAAETAAASRLRLRRRDARERARPRALHSRHPLCTARPPHLAHGVARRAGARGTAAVPLPRSLAPPAVQRAAARARGDLRAVQSRQRPADDAHLHARGAGRDAVARGEGHAAHPQAGQLCADRPHRRRADPDQRFRLRSRFAGRPGSVRRGDALLPRGVDAARPAAPLEQVLPARAFRHPDLPAPVPAVQGEALGRARARGHGQAEAQPERGREDRQAGAREPSAGRQGFLHLHEAVQEHPAKRSRDGVPEHARALPLFRQAAPRRDGERRPRPRRRSAPPARSPCWPPIPSLPRAPSSGSAASPSAKPSTS